MNQLMYNGYSWLPHIGDLLRPANQFPLEREREGERGI